MKKIRIIVLLGIILTLSGCTSNKGIEVLDNFRDYSAKYSVVINIATTDNSIICDFDNENMLCTDSNDNILDESFFTEDNFANILFHLYLSPNDFSELNGDYFITEDGKRKFVQRLPYFQTLLDSGEYTNDEAIIETLEGLGSLVITMDNNYINTLTVINSDGVSLVTYTFSF